MIVTASSNRCSSYNINAKWVDRDNEDAAGVGKSDPAALVEAATDHWSASSVVVILPHLTI